MWFTLQLLTIIVRLVHVSVTTLSDVDDDEIIGDIASQDAMNIYREPLVQMPHSVHERSLQDDQQQHQLQQRHQHHHLQCPSPCKCANSEDKLQCKGGVNIIRDGCDCCFICARQQGDLCDHRNRCDEDKAQFCDLTIDEGMRGICRARSAKSCNVDGKVYKDGEQFTPNCSQLCTCQNGQYACASLCPSEDMAPSRDHCREAQLLSIGGRCCREWVCPHAHSLPRPEDSVQRSNIAPKPCPRETTSWSACSVTCGVGWSVRLSTDNDKCLSLQERSLCIVRPCDLKDKHLEGFQCKTTWRQEVPMRVVHDGCISVKEYRPKYCSTCKRQRCCQPYTEIRTMEMHCTNRTIVEKFAWVKRCKCRENYCK